MATKSEIRNLYSKARTARLFAGEAAAKASDALVDGDDARFAEQMAEVERLVRLSAKLTKQAQEARSVSA